MRFLVKGNPDQIKAELLHFRNVWELMREKDVGQIIGEPAGDYLRRKPVPLSLNIFLSGKSKPLSRGRKAKGDKTEENPNKRVQIKILNPKKSNLEWDKIKTAVGGKNGYLWGRFRAQGNLLFEEGIGKIVVYGSTESGAERRLKALANLSDGELQTISVTEEKKFGVRIKGQKQFKETVRIYPHYFTIINQQQFISNIERDRGRQYIDGKQYLVKDAKIPLWHEKEPSYAKDKIQELLRRGE
ncbi:MAG: hypothetical protein AAGA60_10705 [Cyanobacteria bacterium P01_E01_bin.42]